MTADPADNDDPAFVPPWRRSLYTAPALLGEWTDTDDHSYADTLDGRAYLAAVAQGLRNPALDDTARQRALHDVSITRALANQLVGTRPVAIMGGHEMSRGSDGYRLVAQCARALTAAGYCVLTGGGPGAMEAAHLGASFSDGDPDTLQRALADIAADPKTREFPVKPDDLVAQGKFNIDALQSLHRWQAPAFKLARQRRNWPMSIGIPTWLYGHEPPTPLAPLHAKYFENSIREDGLLAVAVYGVLYAPGKAGTLQEIFQDAAQNYYRTAKPTHGTPTRAAGLSPMVFLDIDEHWSASFVVKPVVEKLFKPDDRRYLHTATTVEGVLAAFDTHVSEIQAWASVVPLGALPTIR